MKKQLALSALLLTVYYSIAQAGANPAGLTLLRNSDARSAALGGAGAAMNNDVAAMASNPASLATLDSGHISLQFERGFFDDSFGKMMIGARTPTLATIGISLGQYNGGKETLYDGVHARSLSTQQDLLASLGVGARLKRVDVGLAATYLSSELAETNKASAVSFDAGAQVQAARSLRLGASVPIAQTKLRYHQKKEDLPALIKIGAAWNTTLPLATGPLPLLILIDTPYDTHENKFFLAMGGEAKLGHLALRAGASNRSHIQRVTLGLGFQFQRTQLDYSFGFADKDDFAAVHKVNLSFRFNDFRSNTF